MPTAEHRDELEREASRPGTGGRQPLASPHTSTTATAELIDELGAPRMERIAGSAVLTWDCDPAGEGIIAARLSSRDVQHGETAMGQVHPARELCNRLEIKPRLIVLTVNNTGAREYRERPDFALIEDGIRAGWCQWVMWRDIDRMAREPIPGEMFLRMVREQEVELYLTRFGRAMSWDEDRLQLRTLVVHSAEDREGIKRRTHDALQARWLREGRGWPGARRFGFRRNPVTKFLEVDPEQWEFVKRAHYGYAELRDGERSGVRPLLAELKSLGCSLSEPRLRRMLADRIYVDGRWEVEHGGTTYPGRTIPLPDPIPEAIFQRNQELLRLRCGKQTTTPVGEFCLNGVPIYHCACRGERDERGRESKLRGFLHRGRKARRYRHSPWVPKNCRGWVVDAAELEARVLFELTKIAEHPMLLEEWRRAHRHREGEGSPLIDDEEAAQLRMRRSMLGRQRARLERLFRDRLAAGEELHERDHAEMVGGIRAEIEQLEARLARASSDVGSLRRSGSGLPGDQASLRKALALLLTPEVPERAPARQARAALVAAALSEVEVVDEVEGVRADALSMLATDAPRQLRDQPRN